GVTLGTSDKSIGSLTVAASSTLTKGNSEATAVAAGAVTFTAGGALGEGKPTPTASGRDHVKAHVAGDVTVGGAGDLYSESSGMGGSLAAGGSGGLVKAASTVSPTLSSSLGDDAQVTAKNISITATQGLVSGQSHTSYVEGYGVNAALLLGANGLI